MSSAHATVAKPSTTNRARVSNDPRYVAGVSGRTPGGRRRRDLAQFFTDALGGATAVTPVQITDIRRAAELTALAEEMRATALRDGATTIDMAALVRLEGAADRATRRLGIKVSANKPASSLAELLGATR